MNDDKAAAEALYMAGFSQKEIAELLDRAEKTISAWAQEGRWREQRTKSELFNVGSREHVQELITFQLRVLNQIRENRETLLNDALGSTLTIPELQNMLLDNKSLDGLQKLFSTLKGKETPWEEIVKLLTDFIDYLGAKGYPNLEALSPFVTDYLNARRAQ